jgi:hypothetical protein
VLSLPIGKAHRGISRPRALAELRTIAAASVIAIPGGRFPCDDVEHGPGRVHPCAGQRDRLPVRITRWGQVRVPVRG